MRGQAAHVHNGFVATDAISDGRASGQLPLANGPEVDPQIAAEQSRHESWLWNSDVDRRVDDVRLWRWGRKNVVGKKRRESTAFGVRKFAEELFPVKSEDFGFDCDASKTFIDDENAVGGCDVSGANESQARDGAFIIKTFLASKSSNGELCHVKFAHLGWIGRSVTRFGDLVDFGQLFKAFGNN